MINVSAAVRIRKRLQVLLPLFVFALLHFTEASADQHRKIPTNAARCDISVPVHINLIPAEKLQTGRTTRFRVDIESELDPNLVKEMWVDHEVPSKLRPTDGFVKKKGVSRKRGQQHYEFGIAIPDRHRYELRVRLKVAMTDGTILTRTAVRYVDLGNNPPDGMVGRLVNANGAGIRIYEGRKGNE